MLPVRVPVAKEGVPFISMSALATIVLALLHLKVPALSALAFTGFVLYFFRDPERIVPHGPDLLTSPADGKVIDISHANEPYFNTGEAVRISIFMNVFNCHVNRSPVSGTVKALKYRQGRFIPADRAMAMWGTGLKGASGTG